MYDVSDKDIKIKCFNHEKDEIEFKKILGLIRKEDTNIYHLVTKSGDILLRCSGAHRIYDYDKKKYCHVEDIESGKALSKNGETIEFFAKKTKEIEAIVDMEVEDNANYFTNGILSHNTTPGGKALKFYTSIRLKISKIGNLDEGTGVNKERVGINVRVECVKNKTAPPFKREEGVIIFGKGFDNESARIEALVKSGIVERRGAGWLYYEDERIIQGIGNLKGWLEDNPEKEKEMLEKLDELRKAGKIEMEESDADKSEAADYTDEDFSEDKIEGDGKTEVGEV